MKKNFAAVAFVIAMSISSSALAYYEIVGPWHHWWSSQSGLFIVNNTGRALMVACNGSVTPTYLYPQQVRACSPSEVYVINDGGGTAGINIHYCNAQWQCTQ
jgi:hypothetical protein